MASADVIATALVDLEPKYVEQWTEYSPVWEKIISRGDREVLQSYQKEFVIVNDGPGTVTSVPSGSEVISGGRVQAGKRGNEVAPRLIYAFDVPGKDIDEANGEQDIARLIESYPDMAMMDFQQLLSEQLVMGNAPKGTGAAVTWNSDVTYNPDDGTARTGWFEFSATQNSTVHGLAMENAGSNPVTGWKHPYKHITSFASNGLEYMRMAYYSAQRAGQKAMYGAPDVLLGDEVSYHNYISALNENVRFVDARNQKGDTSKSKVREGIAFLDSTFYLEEKIVPASFSTASAQAGVIYGICTPALKLFSVGRGGVTGNRGFFSARPPVKLPFQDMYRYEIVYSTSMFTPSLRSHFVVTGANNP